MVEEYSNAKKEYQLLIDYQSQYFSFINTIKAISHHGFTIDALSLTNQIQCQLDINMNLMKTKKKIIDKYEQEVREFSLCLLVSHDKKHEALEKAQLDLKEKELFFVCFQDGFKQFPDGKDYLYKIAIYFTILDENMIPKQPYELKELFKLKLTPSIESNLKQIMEAIHIKFRRRPQQKKRKLENLDNIEEENPSSISSAAVEEEYIKSKNCITPKVKNWFIDSNIPIKICDKTEIVDIIKEFFKNIEPEEKEDRIITNFKADEFNFEGIF
ncbi:20241_t:CDS:2, partial [Gigaspora margarita]